jgi:acyl dehydratase
LNDRRANLSSTVRSWIPESENSLIRLRPCDDKEVIQVAMNNMDWHNPEFMGNRLSGRVI